jgi:thiol-disulfide isomerase/thioredoxin
MTPADWRKWIGRLGWLLLFAAVFLGVRAWQQRDLVTGPAPTLRAERLDGAIATVPATTGKPQLVYFWASWCPVCRLEQGTIDALARDHAVIAIAMSSGNDTAVRGFLKEQQLSFPVVNDPDSVLAQQWGVRGVPTALVVDAQGQIRFREVGYTTGWGLRLRLWWAGLAPS